MRGRPKKQIGHGWQRASRAATLIGPPVSVWILHRRRLDGTLKQGIHWRSLSGPTTRRKTYAYHVERVSALLGCLDS